MDQPSDFETCLRVLSMPKRRRNRTKELRLCVMCGGTRRSHYTGGKHSDHVSREMKV
jgi:hypothetical protein